MHNRRWYQFNLRGLFAIITVVALGSAWMNHWSYCRQRWSHFVQANDSVALGYKPAAQRSSKDSKAWLLEMDRIDQWREHNVRMAEAYRRAIWRPWERLWIDETPPDRSP